MGFNSGFKGLNLGLKTVHISRESYDVRIW
jgi:hypothetical protein